MTEVATKRTQLDKLELKQLKEAFTFFDKDGNGSISPDEIGNAIKSALNIHIDEEGLSEIMNDLDENGDGEMDFDEFVSMMERRILTSDKNIEHKETFKIFDKDGDGKICKKELKETLISLGEDVDDDDVDEIMKDADLNGDGFIDFDEFVIMMNKQKQNENDDNDDDDDDDEEEQESGNNNNTNNDNEDEKDKE